MRRMVLAAAVGTSLLGTASLGLVWWLTGSGSPGQRGGAARAAPIAGPGAPAPPVAPLPGSPSPTGAGQLLPAAPPSRPASPVSRMTQQLLTKRFMTGLRELRPFLERCPWSAAVTGARGRPALLLDVATLDGRMQITDAAPWGGGPADDPFVACARGVLVGRSIAVLGSKAGDRWTVALPVGPRRSAAEPASDPDPGPPDDAPQAAQSNDQLLREAFLQRGLGAAAGGIR